MTSNELRSRITAHCILKGIGSPLAIGLFFVGYFFVLQNPIFPVRMVQVLAIDRWIPLLPWSVWLYFSLWAYVCLPQALMRELRPMGHYLLGATALSGLGLLIFVLSPTAVPAWGVDWSLYPSLAFLKEADASGNACPSLHVAFAVFSGLWIRSLIQRLAAHPNWHWINGLWCFGIILSTMTTKQHVFWDVLAGAALGGLVFALNYWWLKRSQVVL
ncbi:MAG: phosphatase PAP2 family protein [Opitutales bacterium]|nr:phosphatase PAP2 family protein [Opitutales bacterium]